MLLCMTEWLKSGGGVGRWGGGITELGRKGFAQSNQYKSSGESVYTKCILKQRETRTDIYEQVVRSS